MTAALLIVAVVAAAALCPAMMWWNARRGRSGCLPGRASVDWEGEDLDTLCRRQADLAARLVELDSESPVSTH